MSKQQRRSTASQAGEHKDGPDQHLVLLTVSLLLHRRLCRPGGVSFSLTYTTMPQPFGFSLSSRWKLLQSPDKMNCRRLSRWVRLFFCLFFFVRERNWKKSRLHLFGSGFGPIPLRCNLWSFFLSDLKILICLKLRLIWGNKPQKVLHAFLEVGGVHYKQEKECHSLNILKTIKTDDWKYVKVWVVQYQLLSKAKRAEV